MKKIYIITAVIIGLVLIGFATYKEDKFYNIYGKADIKVKEYDFGEITYLDTINYTFEIKNVGDEPLIINKVLPNCDCILVDYEKGIINKNNVAKISTKFIPQKTRLGLISLRILVEGNFNDGVTHLKMKGIVNDIN